MSRLLLATNNRGKLREYQSLLLTVPCELVSLAGQNITATVEETGDTLEENARLKAETIARLSGLLTLADDSGLWVDALGGEPGVKSARYAGEDASDADRCGYLLSSMKDIPWERRTAAFKCVIAIATPEGMLEYCQGKCQGYITFEPRGEDGFGYDPLFYLPDLGKTMAEISPEIKNSISHRARAAIKVPQAIEKLGGCK